MNFIISVFIGSMFMLVVPIMIGSIIRLFTEEKLEKYSVISVLILGWLFYASLAFLFIVIIMMYLIGNAVMGLINEFIPSIG